MRAGSWKLQFFYVETPGISSFAFGLSTNGLALAFKLLEAGAEAT